MEAGHSKAARYPVWKVLLEAEIVVERRDREAALTASLNQMAVASGMGSKKATTAFGKRLKKLTRT